MIEIPAFYKNWILSALGWGLITVCLVLLAADAATHLFLFYAVPVLLLLFWVLVYCLLGLYVNRSFMLGSYFIIYYFLFLLMSCFLVESGALMLEINQFGFPNGSLLVVIVFFILALEFGRVGYVFGDRAGGLAFPRIKGRWEQCFVYVTMFFSVSASLYVVFKYSSPFFMSMERVDFIALYAPSWFGAVKSLVIQSFFLVAVIALSHQMVTNVKRLAWLVLVLYCLFAVLVFGEKFSLLNSFAMMFFLVVSSKNFRFSFWGVVAFSFAVCMVVLLVAYKYITAGRGLLFIVDRIALQAQVVWMYMNFDGAQSAYDVSSCLLGCDEWTSGSDLITFLILPAYLYDFYRATGSILSGFSPAIYLFFLGPAFGVAFFGMISFLLGFMQGYMAVQIRGGGIIFPFLIFKVYFALLLFLYMNDLGVFSNVLVMLALLLIILMLALTVIGRVLYRPVSE